MQDFQKKNADLRKKKQLAKQSVQQKNDAQSLLNGNLGNFMNFGNMNGGGGGGSGVPQGTTPGGTPSTSNMATYITKTGGVISSIQTLPANNANIVQFGYYSIYKS